MNNYKITTIKKNVKNISIKIKSYDEVILTYPLFVKKSKALEFLETKKEWIEKNRVKVAKNWTLIDGEEIFYLGSKYTLKTFISNKNFCTIDNKNIYLYVKDCDDFALKERTIKNFYRQKAKKLLPPLVKKWEEILNKKINKLTIRDSKSRWGSCNTQKAYINLSLNLIKKPLDAIEYVILHELAHLTHPNHSKEFYRYIKRYMPDFKEREKLLTKGNSKDPDCS